MGGLEWTKLEGIKERSLMITKYGSVEGIKGNSQVSDSGS